ncbi:MAG: hypothetical protein H7Z19_03455 [Chitinophagaceae bacterium]|nr:hypothetical protein [Rubrivivax sp.]
MVAVGVVLGAAAAGRWVKLTRATSILPAGVLLGLLVPWVGWAPSVAVALPLLLVVGAMGGALVVPMNALLQHRGHQLLTAGRSIAVQNFNENASVLVMLGVYAALLHAQVTIAGVLTLFGLAVAGVMLLLIWRERRRRLVLQSGSQGRAGSAGIGVTDA